MHTKKASIMPGIMGKGLLVGGASGIIWAFIILSLNALFKIFSVEGSAGQLLLSFIIGGLLFGMITGGFYTILPQSFPLKSSIVKGIIVSVILWIFFRLGGVFLFYTHSQSLVGDGKETLQGLFMAVLLGYLVGFLSRTKNKYNFFKQ